MSFALKDVYDRFTTRPSLGDLHPQATLTYITSGTSLSSPTEIIQFLTRAKRELQSTETILSHYASSTTLTLEVSGEYKFQDGTSWLAPGLEANMIDGMVVKLPLVKIIQFEEGKIRSVRVYWDQSTVLKQLEVFGQRGRGWPITDGQTQLSLISQTLVIPSVSAIETSQQEHVLKSTLPAINVASFDDTVLSKKTPSSRRTYSITNDFELDTKETPSRLPRTGWQNNRQHFSLSEEGDVPLKEQSPVRLPRIGQAPRREFSFSNLREQAETDTSKKRMSKAPAHFEFDDDRVILPGDDKTTTRQTLEIVKEEKKRPKINSAGPLNAIIFHDVEETPIRSVKHSIGGGVGGQIEETIFVELAEDANPSPPAQKQVYTRRDQQSHFSIGDDTTLTPVPAGKHKNFHQLSHFSIEGTPDPREDEYRTRALQRKEVNHFRPDTVSQFEIVDRPEEQERPSSKEGKKENSEGMNKLLKSIGGGRTWVTEGGDSPVPRNTKAKEGKKGLLPHFSFAGSPEKGSEEEKENGRTGSQVKRMHILPKTEEKEWWEN